MTDARPERPAVTRRNLLRPGGASSGPRVHVIGHGDTFEAGGLRVHCYGEWHAPIYPGIPQVRNTGFLVDGRLFHPGDAFTDPGVPVELLLLQLIGFYTKTSLSADYVRQLRPSRVAPIHDATRTAAGQQGEDTVFSVDPPTGLGTGVPTSAPSRECRSSSDAGREEHCSPPSAPVSTRVPRLAGLGRPDQRDGRRVLGLPGLVAVAGAVDGEPGYLAVDHLCAHHLPQAPLALMVPPLLEHEHEPGRGQVGPPAGYRAGIGTTLTGSGGRHDLSAAIP